MHKLTPITVTQWTTDPGARRNTDPRQLRAEWHAMATLEKLRHDHLNQAYEAWLDIYEGGEEELTHPDGEKFTPTEIKAHIKAHWPVLTEYLPFVVDWHSIVGHALGVEQLKTDTVQAMRNALDEAERWGDLIES